MVGVDDDEVPREVRNDPTAREILRVWKRQDGLIFSASVDQWKDPAAWGIALADLAKHVAKAYALSQERLVDNALERVLAGFKAEFE